MKRRTMMAAAMAAGAILATTGGASAQQVNLNVMTAGDQNMVDYITEFLGPMFEKANPGVKVRAVGTGPGDAGSQRIWERLEAQKKANSATVDVDVAVVHQKMAGQMVKDGMLSKYRTQVSTGGMATNDVTKNALGVNVDGYVIPMFNSQIAIAYNPDKVKTAPATYDDLVAYAAANPKRFGHNGIRGGMSGVGFVFGWLYAYAPQPAKLIEGPYDDATVAAFESLTGETLDRYEPAWRQRILALRPGRRPDAEPDDGVTPAPTPAAPPARSPRESPPARRDR